MRRAVLCIFSICLSVVFASCAPSRLNQEILETWIGADVSDLLNHWGLPAECLELPSGNILLVYSGWDTHSASSNAVPGRTDLTHSYRFGRYSPEWSDSIKGMEDRSQEPDLLHCTWFEANPGGRIMVTGSTNTGTGSDQFARKQTRLRLSSTKPAAAP